MKDIILFDVDGTLTDPMKTVQPEMLAKLTELSSRYHLGIVGGSNLEKIQKQIGGNFHLFEFVFAENGLVPFHREQQIESKSIIEFIGSEDRYKEIVKLVFESLFLLENNIPKIRGTFLELRNSCINISPIGRNCSYQERVEFNQFDQKYHVRKKITDYLRPRIREYSLKCSVGGMISIDIAPIGWDKTYCLRFLKDYDNIYFIGDKTAPGGNDYEIFEDSRTKSCTTTGYKNTIEILDENF